ncbi:MAG: TonB-dependent receptor [Chloracidobacterium sp.]|nr:TonB-dependent receptor [Chloracidobacterium sp.]MCO5334752.1 TonB-dependent receptor [Pyrinomonadaceae bacterium]
MFKNYLGKLASAIAFALILSAATIFAQSTVTGGINGKITDQAGAFVPNATVKVTNLGTNATVTVTATSDGAYSVTQLNPGTYRVEITSGNFAPAKAEPVIVEVGRATPVDVKLSVGTAEAVVEVTAEAPVINTSDNSSTSNFNQTAINDLPINGRRWSNFAILSPNAVPDGTFGLISFRGISGLLNNNTIDGGDNNQAFFSEERGRTRINYVISQSSIREFQVNTSNYSAEYGRSAGGVTNAVTKSGTNQFHGELFYYNRNNRNGARNPLQFGSVLVGGVSTRVPVKPVDLREQFGGAIGGPIVKDKLFFFFSYDQQRRNFPGLSVFQNPGYLNTANRTLLLGLGLTNPQIDSTLNFLNSLTGETPRKGNQKIFFPKIDWHVNSNNTFSISYNRLRWKSPAGIQTQAVNYYGRHSFGNDYVNVDSVNARLQSTFSSNILNEFRFQYGRDLEFQTSQEPLPGEPQTGHTFLGPRSPNVFLTNGLQFGIPNFLERPKYPDEKRFQFADSLTYIRGRHTFKFGADINHVKDDTQNLRYESGGYSYNNINDFIVDYVRFSTPSSVISTCATNPTGVGRVPGKCYTSNYSQGIGSYGLKFSTTEYNFFAQDDYRITPRLTINLGLRWEYVSLPSAMLPNSSTAQIPNDLRTLAEATSTLPNDKNNFGPRVGLAYDVFGDGRTSLRAGYGIYYGRIPNSTIYNALINTGNPAGQAQMSVPIATGSTPNPNAPFFPNILPNNPASFTLGAIQFFARDFQFPLINQYDIVLEHQLWKNTAVSVSYIGSLGRNLPTFVDQNLKLVGSTTYTVSGGPGTTFTLPLYGRANTAFQQLTQIQSTVNSEYNAVVFQFNRRFTRGLQMNASYTLARATDTNQNSATFTQNNSPYDAFDRSYDEGPSNFDVRHKLVFNAVWAPQFYKGPKTSFYNYILNGWSVAPIYVFYSGRPYDGNVSGTSLNGSNGDNRFPLNPRNFYRLPAMWNLDLRLSKRFKFNETMALEFLGEAFNIVNRTHVFGVNTTLYTRSGTVLNYNTNFGAVTSTDSTLYRERQIQFSARFQF